MNSRNTPSDSVCVAETSARLSPLAQRIEALGGAMISLDRQGQAILLAPGKWIQRLIVQSPLFKSDAKSILSDWAGSSMRATEVWPGLWLVPLPMARRRRLDTGLNADDRVPAVLLMGPAFLESEQLKLVCSNAKLDFQATVSRLDTTHLVDPAEVGRLSSLLAWMQEDAGELDRRGNELQTLGQQLGESYEELSLLYKLSTSMTINLPPRQFLADACHELQQVAGLKWIVLQLVDAEPRLNDLAGQVFSAGPVNTPVADLKRIGRQLMQKMANGAPPMILDDVSTLNIPDLTSLSGQLLVVSLMHQDKPLGLLLGGEKLDGSRISSVDSKLCSSLASSMAMFLQNLMLYEDMSAMFLGTLHALTSSIDAKDRYTHGHSERVAMLSRQLGRAAGMDEASVERLYIAGLIHDVGKIGVPESVLCKPGRLTDEEFRIIKMHPEIGARILQDIRQMHDLIPGVLHHHERWDGRGYPHGLAGLDIPLLGRLICLADSFDAMSSNRTYRSAMDHQKVRDEVARCGGTHFDPQLTEVFLTLDFEPYLQLVNRHHAQAVQSGTAPTEPGSPRPMT